MFIVEGNIGAGKSTLVKLIGQHIAGINVALEPLHNWHTKLHGQSLLAQFYENPERWAYTMETLTMMCRVQEHLKDQLLGDTPLIVERSIYSGHYCFALNSYENGFMSDLEWQLYLALFNYLIPGRCLAPQGFIYINVDPEVAYQRIVKRNRTGEHITLDYLQQISERHDTFLLNKTGVLPDLLDVPVLILDGNQEFEHDQKRLYDHIEKIRLFIKDHYYIPQMAPYRLQM